MPHTKSAEKRARQYEKSRLRNRAVKKGLKKQLKAFEDVLDGTEADKIQAEFKQALKKLDKAAARKVIHPNAAARKKSQLARALNAKNKKPAGA